MFPRNLVFSVWVGLVSLVAVANSGCTRNSTRIGAPQAPVAEPTANAVPDKEGGQGTRNESEPAIPFDGSKPEIIVVPEPAKEAPLERTTRTIDIYAELTGQSLTCEDPQL